MEIILKYFTDFTEKQVEQFRALEKLYREWNAKINVISRKDIDGLYEKHVLHSLSIAAIFEFEPGTGIIDIGTGGGFPGIPLAIFFPDVRFHLVDSIARKLLVVEDIVKTIGLQNVTVQHTRAGDIKDKEFDFAVSRAVAPLKDLWKWSKPLLKKKEQGTRIKAQDSRDKEQEVAGHSPTPLPTVPAGRQVAIGTAAATSLTGLICLKGGDLAAEIRESGIRPRIVKIEDIFREKYFKEKFLLWIPR